MRLFYKESFSAKLITVFLLTVLIPMLFLTCTEYFLSQNALERKTRDYLKNLIEVTSSKVELSIQGVEDTAFYIGSNQTIQEVLLEQTDDRSKNYAQYKEMMNVLSYYALLREEIRSVNIQAGDGQIYRYAKSRVYSFEREIEKFLHIGENTWMMSKDNLLLVNPINKYPNKQEIGKLVLEIDTSIFYEIIGKINYGEGASVWILDQDNCVIAGQQAELTGKMLPEEYRRAIDGTEDITEGIKIGKDSYTFCVSEELSNGWRILTYIPDQYFTSEIMILRNWVLVLITVISILTTFLIVVIAKNLTRPLKNLASSMKEFGQGNFELNCTVTGNDEVAMLSRSFNYMVADMKELINTVYEQKMLKQEAEMKSLQMQINPHFLYNTLDTINWMARIQGMDDIGTLTAALGDLMRYSLSGKEFVTLEEECLHLRNYLEIQDTRYGDKMKTRFEIEDQVLKYYVPRLLIQPVLENAIVHGVEDKVGPCEIVISAYQDGEDWYIVVADDGVGMTQEAIEHIWAEDFSGRKKGHTSIGICNVNKRIQLAYGKEYGIQIQSQLGAGTKVSLHLKAMEVL